MSSTTTCDSEQTERTDMGRSQTDASERSDGDDVREVTSAEVSADSSADDDDEQIANKKRHHSGCFADVDNLDDRRKKRNKKEKDRSNKICELIMTLHSVLLEGGVSIPKVTKHIILEETIKYVRELQDFKAKAQLLPPMGRTVTPAAVSSPPAPTPTPTPVLPPSAVGLVATPATTTALTTATVAPMISPLTFIPFAAPASVSQTANAAPTAKAGTAMARKDSLAIERPVGLPSVARPLFPASYSDVCQNPNAFQAIADLRGRLLSASPAFLRATGMTATSSAHIFRLVQNIDAAHVRLCELLKQGSGEMTVDTQLPDYPQVSVRIAQDNLGKPSQYLVTLKSR